MPPSTLKALYESDPSERVRLLAFGQYLNVMEISNIDDMRSTLQAALYSPSAAIQSKARHWLSGLEASQRMDAANPQEGVQ